MAEFGTTDAAMSGLRLITGRPKVLAYWIAFNALVAVCALAAIFLVFGDFFRQLMELVITEGEPTPAMVLSLIPRFGLMFLIFVPLSLLVSAIRRGAATRAILQPEADRFGYLRVGVDELRLMAVILVLFLISAVLRGIYGAVIALLTRGDGGEGLLSLPVQVLLAFIFLKLCLAVPQTLDTKSISIFESWNLTKGHTWRIFISYLIVVLISIGFAILTAALFIGFAIAAGGGAMVTIIPQFQTDRAGAIRALFDLILPISIAFAIIGAIMQPIFTALIYCPAAYIYGKISGRTEDVF